MITTFQKIPLHSHFYAKNANLSTSIPLARYFIKCIDFPSLWQRTDL